MIRRLLLILSCGLLAACNTNDGGTEIPNELVGKEWIRLEAGITMREGRPRYSLKRSDITLDTPDNKHLSLPSNADFQQVDLRSYENLASGMYFTPPLMLFSIWPMSPTPSSAPVAGMICITPIAPTWLLAF